MIPTYYRSRGVTVTDSNPAVRGYHTHKKMHLVTLVAGEGQTAG